MMLIRLIRFHGGLRKAVLELLRTDSLKMGELVGTDRFGNKYYENQYYFLGSNRWVRYSPSAGYDYDGSQVESEWFRWLHYMTDMKPYEEDRTCDRPWLLVHEQNPTGTSCAYTPYSTTKPKITPWMPPTNKKKPCKK